MRHINAMPWIPSLSTRFYIHCYYRKCMCNEHYFIFFYLHESLEFRRNFWEYHVFFWKLLRVFLVMNTSQTLITRIYIRIETAFCRPCLLTDFVLLNWKVIRWDFFVCVWSTNGILKLSSMCWMCWPVYLEFWFVWYVVFLFWSLCCFSLSVFSVQLPIRWYSMSLIIVAWAPVSQKVWHLTLFTLQIRNAPWEALGRVTSGCVPSFSSFLIWHVLRWAIMDEVSQAATHKTCSRVLSRFYTFTLPCMEFVSIEEYFAVSVEFQLAVERAL